MRARGFTLLEVMAAVAILGILYVTLMRVAAQGILAEGEGQRRLEASLVADEQLAQIELQLSIGQPPPLGRRDFEVGEFLVTVNVEAFEIPPLEGAQTPAVAQPRAVTPAEAEALRRIDLSVDPIEGDSLHVSRTTWALDTTAFEAALGASSAEGEPGEPEAGAEPEEEPS
jgi:type II secretion system protein I